jgi:1,4-alpha-glucan branching enzyme
MTAVTNGTRGEVTFILKGMPQATEVYLAGDFNQWTPAKRRMSKYKDGTFRAKVQLSPGKYQYKFVADGVWMADAEAREQVVNSYGTLNSMVRIE